MRLAIVVFAAVVAAALAADEVRFFTSTDCSGTSGSIHDPFNECEPGEWSIGGVSHKSMKLEVVHGMVDIEFFETPDCTGDVGHQEYIDDEFDKCELLDETIGYGHLNLVAGYLTHS